MNAKLFFLLFKVTVTVTDFTSREVIQSLESSTLTRLVPEHYDKHTPPATDIAPAIVYFDMTLLDITSVNENDMTFSLEAFITYRWKDWRLDVPLENQTAAPCWNPPPDNLTRPLQFRHICSNRYTPEINRCLEMNPRPRPRLILDVKILEKIWQPDAFFKNGLRSSVHNDWVQNTYLAFHTSDGHVKLFSRMSVTLSCHFDFHHYPHDEQHCEMVIQSLSYRTDLVRFEWCARKSSLQQLQELDHDIFSLPHFTLAEYQHTFCNVASNFTCIKVTFLLARHPDFHILHTYIPTVLIVILSWMSFWIKPDATPARVTLGVTSILTMATQYTQSTQSLPPVSYIKKLDIWMITCVVYVFMALLEFALVYHVYNKCPQNLLPLSSPERSSVNNKNTHDSTQCIVIGPHTRGFETPERIILNSVKAWKRFWSSADSIDQASRYFFPFTYCVFIIGYFLVLGNLKY